jgi:hypothetical protein
MEVLLINMVDARAWAIFSRGTSSEFIRPVLKPLLKFHGFDGKHPGYFLDAKEPINHSTSCVFGRLVNNYVYWKFLVLMIVGRRFQSLIALYVVCQIEVVDDNNNKGLSLFCHVYVDGVRERAHTLFS